MDTLGRMVRGARLLLTAAACACVAPSAMAQVTLSQHCDFGGWSAAFTTTGNFNTAAITARGGINNDASSIRIAPGFRVTLFSGDNQTGTSIVLTGDDNCFVDNSFNDVLSSLRIEAVGGTPIVQLFQHCDFGGWVANFTSAGNFNTADITSRGGLDNDASSIKVSAGFKATLFNGNNQTGTQIVVTAGNTACFVARSFNDVLSSLKIEADGGGDVDDTVVSCGSANGNPYVRVHLKKNVVQVCVQQSFWNNAANANSIRGFFPFFDLIGPELNSLFSFTPNGAPFLIQITEPTGGACACVDSSLTGSDIGVSVTGDAYPNTFTSQSGIVVPGYWGYLLTLHEFINVWTGEMTSGWPTDWWADHRSPFPNAMDETIMRDIGTKTNNQTLLNAATAHHERFDTEDKEVGMFLSFFNSFGGFAPYNRAFALVRGDGLQWDTVSSANPDARRTEYVIAYLQLGFRNSSDLTQSAFVANGVSGPTEQDPAYTISAAHVGDIADAHCSIASARNAGRDVSAKLFNLQHGDFANARVSNATCGASCPAECGCNTSANQCVARWRAQ